jgi:hypothetical protein
VVKAAYLCFRNRVGAKPLCCSCVPRANSGEHAEKSQHVGPNEHPNVGHADSFSFLVGILALPPGTGKRFYTARPRGHWTGPPPANLAHARLETAPASLKGARKRTISPKIFSPRMPTRISLFLCQSTSFLLSIQVIAAEAPQKGKCSPKQFRAQTENTLQKPYKSRPRFPRRCMRCSWLHGRATQTSFRQTSSL